MSFKNKFTSTPELDSEGFPLDTAYGIAAHMVDSNPKGWQWADAETFATQYKGLTVVDGHVRVADARHEATIDQLWSNKV